MTDRDYQQCTRCVMDTSDPDITFDASGHCNHCTDFFARIAAFTYRGEESDRQLQALVERIKRAGRGKEYDCVVGVSGGVDSSYAAYVECAKDCGAWPFTWTTAGTPISRSRT